MGLRQIMFQLFHGTEFQGMKSQIADIAADVKKVLADMALMTVAVATLSQEVAALDLGSLTDKIDMLLRPSLSIWTEETYFTAAPETVEVPVWVRGDPLGEITAFGFHVLFDETKLRFISVEPGEATVAWGTANIAGNEAQPGDVIIGGYAGGAEAVIGSDVAEMVYITFEVLVDEDITIQLDAYVDDFTEMKPEPYYGVITRAVN